MSEIKVNAEVNVTNRVWLDWSKETHIHRYWEGDRDIFQLRVTYLNKHFRILDVGAWHLICSKYWMENQPHSAAGEQCDKSGICLSFEFDKFELYASLAWGWACAGLATQFQNIWKGNFGSDSSCYGYAVSCNMPPHMLLLWISRPLRNNFVSIHSYRFYPKYTYLLGSDLYAHHMPRQGLNFMRMQNS